MLDFLSKVPLIGDFLSKAEEADWQGRMKKTEVSLNATLQNQRRAKSATDLLREKEVGLGSILHIWLAHRGDRRRARLVGDIVDKDSE
jgi:hypothetical protein